MSDATTPSLGELIQGILDRMPDERTGPLADELVTAIQPEILGRALADRTVVHATRNAAEARNSAMYWRERAERSEADREEAEAAVARVRALATNADRTGCGAAWNLDPAAVLASLGGPACASS